MIGMTIEGRTTFLDLQIAGRRMDETLRTTIRDTAREYQGRLKAALSQPGSGKQYGARIGRVYRRTRKSAVVFGKAVTYRGVTSATRAVGPYRASAPGRPPARRTGTLLRSVKIATRQSGYNVKVFADKGLAFYRHFLEFGTAERFQRDRSKDVVVGTTRRGRAKVIKGRGKSVGRALPRPVFSPLQAELDAEMERRVLRAVDLFAAFRG